ncbi:MAG: hypothetical protein AAGK67_15640 [Pseudomonadota bacterium]
MSGSNGEIKSIDRRSWDGPDAGEKAVESIPPEAQGEEKAVSLSNLEQTLGSIA